MSFPLFIVVFLPQMTALHFSVAYERVEHTKMLLHAKASPDCQDSDKKTVLHWAKTNKETTIVSKLLVSIIYFILCFIISCHVTSCHFVSYHVMSCRVTS